MKSCFGSFSGGTIAFIINTNFETSFNSKVFVVSNVRIADSVCLEVLAHSRKSLNILVPHVGDLKVYLCTTYFFFPPLLICLVFMIVFG